MDNKKSVLVVDDEPIGFKIIEALLHREGCKCTYASRGNEALNCIDEIKPDVILLDVMMPDMNGMEVCRRIKANSTWSHIPIIMVTALNSKEDLARCLDAGADDFLTKPVSGIELRARVRSMLRIKQQYDALSATLQLREDFSNMVVHDLRKPLTNILLSSTLLLQSGWEGKNLERLQIIANCGRELNSMIDNLLMLAKMESGKMVLNLSEVELNELASKVVSGFDAIAEQKKIRLISKLPLLGRAVLIDTNLFDRVLDNLISNAIKFSPPESTVVLQVDYPDEHLRAIVRVIDCGIGISEDMRQRIFDKYEVGSLKSGISQIGLGLSFCKMVVEAHGGRIFAEANQPKGSIFTVEI